MIDASMFPMMGHIVDIRHIGIFFKFKKLI
jgi:hypothetical protein